MTEKRHSISIPVGKSELITVYSGTKQVYSYEPDKNAEIVVDVQINEVTPNKKG